MASGVGVVNSLDIRGKVERDSAKQRRRDEYKQDLELQIQEKNAARQRERLQDMSVNASGYLDPEKRPDRFKPLGGVHWLDQREKKPNERVRPYHTLFLYDRLRGSQETPAEPALPASSTPPPMARFRRVARNRTPRVAGDIRTPRGPSPAIRVVEDLTPVEPLVLRQRRAMLDSTAGIHYQPSTYAAAGGHPANAVDHAYSFLGAHDLSCGPGGGGGGSSIVQPISMPHGDSRPIIVQAQGGGSGYHAPRYNPFEIKGGNSSKDYQSLLLITQSEKDRIRRDNDDFQRRLRQELEDERKKLSDQEIEARRRLEELRRQAEERRREAERERKEAERLRKAQQPKIETIQRPSSKKTMVYDDMNDYRLGLIEERKKIEELLKAGKPVNDTWDLKVIRKPPLNLPPTPKSADRANRDNVNDFNYYKYRDDQARDRFRIVYPDVPMTNKRLEQQQEALIQHQEASLREHSFVAPPPRPTVNFELPTRRAISRPSWLDREPTPFPHVLRKRDRLYTSHSDGDVLGDITHRSYDRHRAFDSAMSMDEDAAELEGLKLRPHRSVSRATLLDDTWLRPSSKFD